MQLPIEKTLDPADWSDHRKLGHKMIDDVVDYLSGLRDRPAWQPIPRETKKTFEAALPIQSEKADQVYQEFKENVFPYPVGNIHPRYFGWVQGNGTIMGAYADLLAATMNPNSWGGNQSAVYVEKQVIEWMKEVVGFPKCASGVMVSGASVANLIGLSCARTKYGSRDVNENGLDQKSFRLRIYCSRETHNSVHRAAALLGIGKSNVVSVPTTPDRRIDTAELQTLIRRDRFEGMVPMCIVGTAGTVGTGAIDDLDELARIAKTEDVWFHVDGAIGAAARASEKLAPLFAGIEKADSVAFDFHKWMFIPYEAGCVLVRDQEIHHKTFSNPASYLSLMVGGVTSHDETFFNDYGIELSRSMKALKVWMTLKEQGVRKIAEIMEQNVEQIQYLRRLLEKHEPIEIVGTGLLNILCFRYVAEGLSSEELNEFNKALLIAIQESGVAVPSPSIIDGKFALRVCITNHRTKCEDLDILVTEVLGQGKLLLTRRCEADKLRHCQPWSLKVQASK
jgi:aromatic-L-amino-acid/L-tryptophan decarboxylase